MKNNKTYIGYTPNLIRRVKSHNMGENRSTKAYMPWKLIYYEAYTAKEDAVNRESQLKSRGQAVRELKRRLGNSMHPQSEFGAR